MDFANGKERTKVCLSEITYTFSNTLVCSWEKQAKYHPPKAILIIFPCLGVNISFVERDLMGFSIGIKSAKVWLSEKNIRFFQTFRAHI